MVCSKGTYVRVLAEDIGTALGCGAHLSALRRTGSGRFRLEDALSLDALETLPMPERRASSAARLLRGLRAELGAAEEARLRQGQALKVGGLERGFARWCVRTARDRARHGRRGRRLKPLRLTQTAEKHLKSAAHMKRE